MADFDQTFRTAYGFDAPGIDIGNVMKDGKPLAALPIRIPLAMMNRHGLIAGSTGTGKTRSSSWPKVSHATAFRFFSPT